jgi:hypothetical protein
MGTLFFVKMLNAWGCQANYALASPENVELFEEISRSILTPRKRLDRRECCGRDDPVHPPLALRRAVLLNGYHE